MENLLNSYTGKIREVTIGGDGLIVGGQNTLPFYLFEGEMPHKPLVAMEVLDIEPTDWPPALTEPLSGVLNDPLKWAKKCEDLGADLICLYLLGTSPDGANKSPEEAGELTKKMLENIKVPLVIYGSGDKEKDPKVFTKVTEAALGKNILFGPAQEENYKLVAGAALATQQNVIAFSPLDINLAKQQNILITQMGVKPENIVMDPTTGALGYGLEYCFSILERLKLAALQQNDTMTQMPIICTVGKEVWKVKEAKVSEAEEPSWGNAEKRGINWEVVTAFTLLLAGADIVVVRHPKSLEVLHALIKELLS